MQTGLRTLLTAVAAVGLVGALKTASAQVEHLPFQLKYSSGQGLQPIFEGWSKNPDGGFSMHFGYLNRNYVEELHVPLGPQNSIEPGGPDRGQPTYFYTRLNHRAFSVQVPRDFGKKEMIWTVTFRGQTTKAVGWLQPEWEIDAPGTSRRGSDDGPRNMAPTLTLEPAYRVVLPGSLTLTASVADDGLPKPTARAATRKQAVGQETPPILQPGAGTAEAPVNVPELRVNPRGGRIAPRPPQGLSVGYLIWRGPGAVTAEPPFAQVKDGSATTTVTFAKPGEYVIRARASDGALSTEQDIKVTVVGPPIAGR